MKTLRFELVGNEAGINRAIERLLARKSTQLHNFEDQGTCPYGHQVTIDATMKTPLATRLQNDPGLLTHQVMVAGVTEIANVR